MFRKIKLYGNLAEYTGHKEFEVNSNAVKTPLQAVRFLTSNFKGVEQHISQNNYQVMFIAISLSESFVLTKFS